MVYTGIGSRKINDEIISALVLWGKWLGTMGLVLRSGAAAGADHAFESGCNLVNGKKEIYLPWKAFNSSDSDLYYIPPEAFEIAGDIYGATWRFQKAATKKFMARNMMQVMGIGLDEPSKFVICWTPDGCNKKATRTKKTGGTGQAVAYADEMDIPVFNFQQKYGEDSFIDHILNNVEKYNLKKY